LGLFAQSEVEWTRYLRTTVGLRGDVFRYKVESDNAENSGTEHTGVVSPKASAVLGPWAGTEIYLNGGFGFHSNNALGATLHVDPITGEHADRSTPIVHARGAEVGVRTVRLPGLQATLTLWTLAFDAELLFVGDAGTTEAGRPSRRWGIEWTNYYSPHPWVTLDFDLSFSRARFTDEDPAGDAIPGALDRVISGGVTIEEPEGGVFSSLRLRHFGPRALIEDNSVQSQATTLVNGEIGYQFSRHMRLVGEMFNLFDSKVSDIDYFYTSRLPGEPLGGVDDIHTHAALPRGVRVALQFSF
jgi:outer membrane receptor protein involved in Fe transport